MTNVGYATLTVVPTAKGFKAALDKEISAPLAASGDRAGRTAGKKAGAGLMGGIMPVVGKLGPAISAAFAGVAIGGFLKDSVGAASDLNETLAKTGQIFGSSATPAVTDFADKASTAFGQTKQQALDAAATFGIFGKSAGLTGPELAGFSTDLAGLASDLASFNNTDVDTAITAVSAALRGESEPIRQFGVLLDEDTLKAEALEKGIVKASVNMDKVAKANKNVAEAQKAASDAVRKYGANSDEAAVANDYLAFKQQELGKALKGTVEKLTPQQRVLAAQSAIFKQTGDAQGDFARTSGGLANQQRILSAEFGNLKSTVGQAFLPLVTGLVTLANKAFPPLQNFAKKLEPFGKAVNEFFTGLFSGAAGGAGALDPLISGFKSFGAVVGPALASLGGPIKEFATAVAPALRDIGTKVIGVLGPGFAAIGSVVATKFVPAFKAILPVLAPVAKFILGVFGGALVGILSGAIKVITGVIQAFAGLLDFVVGVFTGNWSKAWQGLKDVVGGLLKGIVGAIQVWLNVSVLKVFGIGMGLIRGLWTKGLELLKAAGPKVLSGMAAGFRAALATVGKVLLAGVKGYLGIWRSLLSGLLSILKNGWSVLRSAFGGALAAIRTVLANAVSLYIGIWRRIFSGLLSAARTGLSAAVKFLGGMKEKFVGALKGAGKWLFDTGKNIVNGLLDGAGSILAKVGNFFLDKLPGWIRTPFKKALGIASPSKVFAGFGVNITEGLVSGLSSESGAVRSAVRSLSNTVAGSFDGGLTIEAAARASGSIAGPSGAAGATFAPVVNNYYPEPEKASEALPVALRRAAFASGF